MNTSSAKFSKLISFTALTALVAIVAQAQPDPNWLGHDRLRPLPPVVDPGVASTPEQAGKAPSDAVVLFNGSDLSAWTAMDGAPTKWVVKDGAMECVPGSGYIRTLQCFGDCQLHLEFATPAKVHGDSQGRGNSGVFFGLDRYEIQVLDSYNNKTYADGSCGSVYIQYPPLVNASRPPGQWQSYDILWTAPQFDEAGKVTSKARLTVFHNGVLIQNNVELTGPTAWLTRSPYSAHPNKLPIALQDHGNPVRYRNIWLRELGKSGKKEFMLANALLDSYCGTYERDNHPQAEVSRGQDGTLVVKFSGVPFTMFAESPTHFFAKTTDVQAEFDFKGDEKAISVSVGENGGHKAKKVK